MRPTFARGHALIGVLALYGCARSSCGTSGAAAGSPLSVSTGTTWAFGGSLPGAPPIDLVLASKLEAQWSDRSADYKPRTRHLRADGSPKYTNRLFLESSPYLRQHAHNPVNWYAWGDEAFEAAKKLGRPVFLSIGYSTCHWCHVMEEESFEDEDIARYLNEHFIAIKVDREERPDIDAIYMQAVEMLTGAGGWPMSTWLTPERQPFYGGTYFPPQRFSSLLRTLVETYRDNPSGVADTARRLTREIDRSLDSTDRGGTLPTESVLSAATARYRASFDPVYGGTNGAPKFPSSLPVRFLLHQYARTASDGPRAMAALTLEKMAAGGIHDHVAGGFHRYSTDARWLVPHFEKMLYDNALLTMDYLAGYESTGRQAFADVARDILLYVDRDMTSPEGGFYSATDADSPGPSGGRPSHEEGRFFTWTPDEIASVVGQERGRMFDAYYGVTLDENFEGRSILSASSSLGEFARSATLSADQVAKELDGCRDLLYLARAKRPQPARDEKILTAWNGLMISAYAEAALVLGNPAYEAKAARAADFVLNRLRKDDRLLRSFTHGSAATDAYVEDYAFLIAGLLDLFEASGNPRWIQEAVALDATLEGHYEDASGGGFFRTSDDHATLLAREKPGYDGAEPSGNSVEALNLLRLRELTSDRRYGQRAERTLGAFGRTLSEHPESLSEMLLALDFQLGSPKEIVLVAPTSRTEAEPFLAELRKRFVPNRVLTIVIDAANRSALEEVLPAVREKVARRGQATAYVCEKQTCQAPTTDPGVFLRQIENARPSPR
jgi:uncharacterized protein YyaL (SSP411 family)